MLWRASRRRDLPARVPTALQLIAAGIVSTAVGAGFLLAGNLVRPDAPNIFTLGDPFFLGFYPLALLGLLVLPRVPLREDARWRLITESLVFVIGAGGPILYFATRPVLADAVGVERLLIAAYPTCAFVGVVIASAVMTRGMPMPSREAFRLLLAAITVSCLGDLVFSIERGQKALTSTGINWTNITNAVSLELFAIAAWRYQGDHLSLAPVRGSTFSPIPLLTIGVVAVWLIVLLAGGHTDRGAMQLALTGMIVLFFVLLLREGLAIRDNLRRLATDARRESQARFAAMVRHSSDIIVLLDEHHCIRFVSPAVERTLGVAPASLHGLSILTPAHPDDHAAWTTFLGRLRLVHDSAETTALRAHHVDGSWRILETAGTNLLDEPGVQGLVLNARDETEREELGERLRQAQKMEACGAVGRGRGSRLQ